MNTIEQALRRVTADLQAANVPFALIGGMAVSLRSRDRFTNDVDLAVSVATDEEAERIVFGLSHDGFRPDKVLEQTENNRLATVRLLHTDSGGPYVDLLFASSGIEPEIVAAAPMTRILPGLRIPVATVGHLVALKVLAMNDSTRMQDMIDARNLIAVADTGDLEQARDALRLIEQRGYQRDKNLMDEFDRLLSKM